METTLNNFRGWSVRLESESRMPQIDFPRTPVEGFIVICEDEEGKLHPWPVPRTPNDVEDLCIGFAMVFINIEAIYFHRKDLEAYTNNFEPVTI